MLLVSTLGSGSRKAVAGDDDARGSLAGSSARAARHGCKLGPAGSVDEILADLGLVLHSPVQWVIQEATALLWPCLFGHLSGSFARGGHWDCTEVCHVVLAVAGDAASFQCGPLSVPGCN